MPRLRLAFVSIISIMSYSVLPDTVDATSTTHSNNTKSKKPVSKSCIQRKTYVHTESTEYGREVYRDYQSYLVNTCSYPIGIKYRCINAGFASADVLNGTTFNLKSHYKMNINEYGKCSFSQVPFNKFGDDGDSDGPE